MDVENKRDGIVIDLSTQEAIVLFDWISRFNKSENSIFLEDQAEERVLWDIESSLEKNLSEVLSASYKEFLMKARDEIRDAPRGSDPAP